MLLSETTGIRFGLDQGGRELIVTDVVTGQELLSDEEEYQARLRGET